LVPKCLIDPSRSQLACRLANSYYRFWQAAFVEMHNSMDWDDLRLVLAVARESSLSGAARTLGITHSTVFRRLGAIEQRMGVRLFERFRNGYAATPAGEIAARVAGQMADEVLLLERRLAGQDLRPSGTVRIATTDTISILLLKHLSDLRGAHPEITVEVSASNAMANLTRREADIALRPTADPPELLVGRRLADIAHAVYASPEYLSRHDSKDLSDHQWIGLDDALVGTVIGRWLRDAIPRDRIPVKVDTLLALRDAAAAGMGLVMLPCYLGDLAAPSLRRALGTLTAPTSALWLLTHDDLKHTARIRAVMDFLATAFASERALLEGKKVSKGPLRYQGDGAAQSHARP
jgi:DNA-binding transcriptional LysR family regulator